VVNTAIVYITYMPVNPTTTTRKLVSLPKPMVQEIRNFRFEHRIDTESDAIRRLIEIGLKAVSLPSESDAHRQSLAVATSAQATEDQAFIDAVSDRGEA
jgi:hypothetical protein